MKIDTLQLRYLLGARAFSIHTLEVVLIVLVTKSMASLHRCLGQTKITSSQTFNPINCCIINTRLYCCIEDTLSSCNFRGLP